MFGAFSRFLALALEGNAEATRAAWSEDMSFAAWQVEFLARQAGEAWALIGDTRAALGWLRRATALGFINYPFLAEFDRHLAGIRHTPEFQAYLAEVKVRYDAFEA